MVKVYRGGEVLFDKVKLAGSFGARLRGLMFYREMPEIDGLLLYPCNSVHMFWMRFPLGLIYLSRERVVLRVVDNLAPNKIGPQVKKAFYVLEVTAGLATFRNIQAGDRLLWE